MPRVGGYTDDMVDRPAVAPRYEHVLSEPMMDRLRRMFRSMNRSMVLMWRLGLGRWADAWPSVGGRILVVEHHGRRSGRRYLTPLNFTPENRSRFCIAAFGTRSDWYRNALATGRVVVWLPDGTWIARVSDATDEEGARDRIRRVLIDSGFAARAFGLNPRVMTDEEVDTATADYRLVRLDLIDRCDEDPADLWWVWLPVAAGAAVVVGAGAVAHRWRKETDSPTSPY
jgi:deazaflavin-dependent oxidoreductase (nitroreductase family)